MPSANCFDAPTLKDYLLGRLSDEQSDVVAAHLEACLSCEATVSQLDRASDTLTSGLRLPALAPEPATDDALQRALDKVQSLEPAAQQSLTAEVSADRSPVLRDYRLLEPLGSGGMGQVFKAVHTRLDRLVAVKLLPARRLGDDQAVARFQREMRVIGQLSHPAIVQATDAGEVDGTHFLVMEYVEGCDLNTLAKACGPLSIADACEIARQAAVGLEYAHQQGIVHRDIKPSNLMLAKNSEFGGRNSERQAAGSNSDFRLPTSPFLKILDLGLALLSGVQAPVDELTTVGQLMGTLDYMAPEQLEDSHLVGPRADIYALAATLYRLLTGFAPFANDDRKTPLQKLRALATQSAPPIRERRADLPEELAAIIDKALSRDSAARFSSMSEFAAALAPWCAGHDLNSLAKYAAASQAKVTEASRASRSHAPRGNAAPDALRPEPHRDSNHAPIPQLARLDAERQGVRSHAERGNKYGASSRRTLLVALALLIVAAFGVVITIETNKGTLIVESLRDGVEVRVKKSGKYVEQLELTTGPKTARLTAGEYEIEILGDADGLQIQNGKFVLKRGDTVVAKVTEVPKGQSVARKSEPKEPEHMAAPVVETQPRQPIDILDRNAKGMNTFFESNPDLISAQKVRDAVQKKVSVDFDGIPLTDCVSFLKEQADLELFIDDIALTEDSISLDSPCTLRLKDVRIATALEFLLRPLNCAWDIDQGQVRITTIAKQSQHMVTRWYPVGRLLPGVRQAVERLNAEGPDSRTGSGGGGFSGGTGGGGFFRVGDEIARPMSVWPIRSGGLTPTELLSSRARQEAVFTQLFGSLPDGRGSNKRPPTETELCWFGGGVNFTVAGHFEDLFSATLSHPWLHNEGEGGTFEFLQNVLVVRHTWRAHADIESLLRLIESAFFQPLSEPIEIRPAGYVSEADVATRKKLKQILDADFQDTPLSDVAEWIRERLDVQILLDRVAMDEEAIASDVPVTLHFKGISGELLLSRWLEPLQLGHQIAEGLLIVTTAAKAKGQFVTKVYDIRDLLDRGLHPKDPVRAIESATSGLWINADGEGGSMLLFADTLLIVQQTSAVHDEITNFLAGLRTQLGDQPKVPRVIKPRPKTPLAAQPNQPTPNEPKPTPPAPAKPTADNQPRYEGKTFDEWLAVLDVERSPARLADAFQALRLLYRDDQAENVARKVLTVFRSASPGASHGSDPKNQKQIVDDARELLEALPARVVQDAAASELGSGNSRSRRFVFNDVLARYGVGAPIASSELPKAVLAISRDSDAAVRSSALHWLTRLPRTGIGSEAIPEAAKRFRESLADKAPEVAYPAVKGLVDSEPDTTAVIETLKRLLGTPAETSGQTQVSELQGEALILVAVMGPRAASSAPNVAPFVLLRETSGGLDQFHGPRGFFIGPGRAPGSIQLPIQSLAALALARMGKAAAAELPTIEEALKQTSTMARSGSFGAVFGGDGGLGSPPNGAGGFGGATSFARRGQRITPTFKDLLVAAKVRLEDRPAPDPQATPVEVTVEMVARLHAILALLQTEQALLEQHFQPGTTRPELRELNQKLKAVEEEFDAASKLYNEQRRNPPRTAPATPPPPKPKPVDQPDTGRVAPPANDDGGTPSSDRSTSTP